MALEEEVKTYERELANLLADSGKFVLIHKDSVIGVFAAYEDALKAGYAQLGPVPFLVKRIEGTEKVLWFTRDLQSCLT